MKKLIDLIFPQLCIACSAHNRIKGDYFCVHCRPTLNFTDHFEVKDNAFKKRFYGRLDIHAAAALFWYNKGDIVQKMIFGLKYNNQQYIAKALGTMIGTRLKNSPIFQDIDLLVPVPLHPKKLYKRGFNQSALLVESISEVTEIPFATHLLIKNKNTISQTKKSHVDRLLSLEKGFSLNTKYNVAHKNILLVDDVLTTGATLEASALPLFDAGIEQLSMMTIAIGKL